MEQDAGSVEDKNGDVLGNPVCSVRGNATSLGWLERQLVQRAPNRVLRWPGYDTSQKPLPALMSKSETAGGGTQLIKSCCTLIMSSLALMLVAFTHCSKPGLGQDSALRGSWQMSSV